MAYNFSTTLEKMLINCTLNASVFTGAATVFVGLLHTCSADGETYIEVDETNVDSYFRQDAHFTAPTSTADGATTANDANIQWSAADTEWAAGGASSMINFIGLFNSYAAGDGDLLYWGALDTSRAIAEGDTFQIPLGDLTVTLR